jgi:hypothetical protein
MAKSSPPHALKCSIDIIDFDRKIRGGRASAAVRGKPNLDAHILVRAESRYPAKIHQQFEAEHVNIGDDSLDFHLSLIATAPLLWSGDHEALGKSLRIPCFPRGSSGADWLGKEAPGDDRLATTASAEISIRGSFCRRQPGN